MSLTRSWKLGDQGAEIAKAKAILDRFFPEGGTASPTGPTRGPIFDFNLHLRVMAMQAKLNRPTTGILDEELMQAYEQFLRTSGNIVAPLDAGDLAAPPESIAKAREAIFNRAKSELELWGFPNPRQIPANLGDRIVAGRRSEGKLRQGGVHLSTIYQISGAHSSKCLVLTDAAIAAYSPGGPDRNAVDIGSWCGIFAIYCYRMAGINVSPWSVGGGLRTDEPGAEFRATSNPQKGDIGIMAEGVHHLIVEKVANGRVYSIDGNVDIVGLPSVISYKDRELSKIHSFYTPIWERVLNLKS